MLEIVSILVVLWIVFSLIYLAGRNVRGSGAFGLFLLTVVAPVLALIGVWLGHLLLNILELNPDYGWFGALLPFAIWCVLLKI